MILGAVVAVLLAAGSAAAATTGTWKVQATPNPSGASSSELTGISCPTASSCFAVGSFEKGSGPTPRLAGGLVESWDGHSWSLRTVSLPRQREKAGFVDLTSVSCSSPRSCMAVGFYRDASDYMTAFAERWSGGRWRLETGLNPPHALASELYGVSCISKRWCIAVGNYTPGSLSPEPLSEVWTGSSWEVRAAAPVRAHAADLYGVSCRSLSQCVAVGSYVSSSRCRTSCEYAMAQRWNGTAWSEMGAPRQPGGLQAVSCGASRACVAVGSSSSTKSAPISEHWEGGSWQLARVPAAPYANLSSVSCRTATACMAIGPGLTGTAEGWEGAAWRKEALPPALKGLQAISCSAMTACTSVGSMPEHKGTGTTTLAVRYS